MSTFTKCPLCGKNLSMIEGKNYTIYICDDSEEHKFVSSSNKLLYSPSVIPDTTVEDFMYFRAYELKDEEYSEIFDKETHENLLSLIQSQNFSMKELVDEYNKLAGEYKKLMDRIKNTKVDAQMTKAGILLR